MEIVTAIGLWFVILVVIAIPTLIIVVGLVNGDNTESALLALILVICVYALLGSFIITGFYYHPEEYGYYRMEMED